MVAEVDAAHKDGDTLGGVVEVVVTGLPPGLGSHVHWDRRLDARLAAALMGIQAIKGVEVGDGFRTAARRGSVAHDEMERGADGVIRRRTGRAGGTEGGMSVGGLLRVRAAMKPISTVPRALETVDVASDEPARAIHQRSDVCAVPGCGGRRRGDGRARAGRGLPGEVRRRLGGRDRAQPRVVPGRHPGLHAHLGRLMARVVLVGPPGSGKTTVGAALAELLGVCRCTTPTRPSRPPQGRTISDIFVEDGEPAFRALERAEVARAVAEEPGCWPWAVARRSTPTTEQLLEGQTVVFLDVGIADASKRVGFDQSRPLLAVNPRASWVRLMNERRPLYERVATFRVDTAGARRRTSRPRSRACWGSRERHRRCVAAPAPPSSRSATRTTSSSGTGSSDRVVGLLGRRRAQGAPACTRRGSTRYAAAVAEAARGAGLARPPRRRCPTTRRPRT